MKFHSCSSVSCNNSPASILISKRSRPREGQGLNGKKGERKREGGRRRRCIRKCIWLCILWWVRIVEFSFFSLFSFFICWFWWQGWIVGEDDRGRELRWCIYHWSNIAKFGSGKNWFSYFSSGKECVQGDETWKKLKSRISGIIQHIKGSAARVTMCQLISVTCCELSHWIFLKPHAIFLGPSRWVKSKLIRLLQEEIQENWRSHQTPKRL